MKHFIRFIISTLIVLCLSVLPVELPIISSVHVEAATVKLNKTKVSIYVGNRDTLTLTGTKLKTTWTTSDKKIAVVSMNGVVKGIKSGTTTITAKVGSSKYDCKVTVLNPEISKTSLDLAVADTHYLSIKGSTGTVTWKSSDNEVVTVNKNGFVYAKENGTAKVTGSYKGKNYTCNVTVAVKLLHASTTSVTCSRETQIMIYWDSSTASDDDQVYWQVADPSIITCQWGEWVGDSLPLSIVLNDYGTTTITITADNTDEKIVIDVTVIDDKRPKAKKLSAEDVYAKCSNATVQINTDLGLGSGFFISSGKVITNYHVIEGASSIKVQLNDDRSYDVEYILGYSKELDIAILSIPIETEYLPINNYSLNVGEAIYAIGSPLGLTDTFTNGIISNISRYDDNVDYIQVNAAITHGNSGGPLINAYGEVIGINSKGFEGEDLNFAINIYQLYQVDTSCPLTVSDYAELISGSDNNSTSANPSITNAPFAAQEGSIGKIKVVFPKDWSSNELAHQDNNIQVAFYPSTEDKLAGSNIIITVQEAATALTYDTVKKYYTSVISSDFITSQLAISGIEGVVVSGFKTSDFETKNGTVFKAEYSIVFKVADEEVVLNQVLYGLCINNYLIGVVITDVDSVTPDIYQVAHYLLDSIKVAK
jgi:hypothetical protein